MKTRYIKRSKTVKLLWYAQSGYRSQPVPAASPEEGGEVHGNTLLAFGAGSKAGNFSCRNSKVLVRKARQ